MLCYVMLCYVMLCYVMLCYVMLCYVMLCYVMLCYVMLCYVMLCYVMLCYVMLCYVMLCYVMLCYVITSLDMSEELKSALLGFHAFTGNDNVSSIFGKSKKICWKAVTKSSKYARMFNRLGETLNLDENSITLLEQFVCSLYRKNKKRYQSTSL